MSAVAVATTVRRTSTSLLTTVTALMAPCHVACHLMRRCRLDEYKNILVRRHGSRHWFWTVPDTSQSICPSPQAALLHCSTTAIVCCQIKPNSYCSNTICNLTNVSNSLTLTINDRVGTLTASTNQSERVKPPTKSELMN